MKKVRTHINQALLISVVIWSMSCANKKEINDHTNEDVVKSMFEAFNQHDWKAMADHYSDSALFLDPAFGIEYVKQSRSEVIAKYTDMQKMFPDIHDEVIGVYPSGDKVSVEFISTGTAADGTSFKLPISCILTLANGKIVKDATYYDQ
jgi:ketosteroid isomerase-like protein